MPMSDKSGCGEASQAGSASDHARSTSALASELGVKPVHRLRQVLEEPPPAGRSDDTHVRARVNIGVHGDFNASGMCKVLEKETKSMHRLEELLSIMAN